MRLMAFIQLVYPELAKAADGRIVCVAADNLGGIDTFWNVQTAGFTWQYGLGTQLSITHDTAIHRMTMMSDGARNVYVMLADHGGFGFKVYKLDLSALTWSLYTSFAVSLQESQPSMERKPPTSATIGYVFYGDAPPPLVDTLFYGTITIQALTTSIPNSGGGPASSPGKAGVRWLNRGDLRNRQHGKFGI